MDNLTHTLIGAVAGEALARTTRARPGGLPEDARRSLLVVVSALGSNLPDIDLAWTYRGFSGSSLGYLLEHRGYTHTLLGCAALALLLYGAGQLWARWRAYPLARGDHLALGGIAAFAVFGHLGMDALNSYGVHPFWPWSNRWYYGDSLFIVEPLYWLAALPLLFIVRTTLARVVLGAAALVTLLVTAGLQRAQPLHILGAVAIAIALGLIGRRCAPRTAALAAAGAMLLLTAGFVAASHSAGERMKILTAQAFPAATTLDTVLTPSPTNPGCWDVLLLQTEAGVYDLRRGQLAIGLSPRAQRCSGLPQGQGGPTLLRPVSGPTPQALRWTGEFSMPADQLARLARTDCAARELLQFARAPFAVEREGLWVLGDLRFERPGGAGFAAVELPATLDTPCRFNAPWTPPRRDLLSRGE